MLVQETFRNISAACITWSACAGGSEAHWCSIQRGVHEWPGNDKDCGIWMRCVTRPYLTLEVIPLMAMIVQAGCFTGDDWGCRRATQDINATRQIWAFFDRISRARR